MKRRSFVSLMGTGAALLGGEATPALAQSPRKFEASIDYRDRVASHACFVRHQSNGHRGLYGKVPTTAGGDGEGLSGHFSIQPSTFCFTVQERLAPPFVRDPSSDLG